MSYNEVAILITQKIVLDLQRLKRVSFSDDASMPPPSGEYIQGTFFEVRESILRSVSDLVRIFEVEHSMSPEHLIRASTEELNSYQKFMQERIIGDISKQIYESKVFAVETFQPDVTWGCMRKDTYSVGLIDLGKVQNVLRGTR